jgi:uncharacterized protein YecT (DUF1311 family)
MYWCKSSLERYLEVAMPSIMKRSSSWFGSLSFVPAFAGLMLSATTVQAQTISKFDAAYAHFPRNPHVGSATFKACIKGSGGITVAMRECMYDEIRMIDKALPVVLDRAAQRVAQKGGRKAMIALRQSQKAWQADREKPCGAETEAGGGGTASLIIGDSCTMNERSRRLTWLRRL